MHTHVGVVCEYIQMYSQLVSSLAIDLARLRGGALRRAGVWRLLRKLRISTSQLPVGSSSLEYDVDYTVASADIFGLAHEGTYVRTWSK